MDIRIQHQEAVQTELESAGNAGSVEQRLRLAELYRTLGLNKAVLTELTRISRQFPGDQEGLACLLNVLTEHRQIAQLRQLIPSAQKIAQPCTALRIAIASASTLLRMHEIAANQYAELIKARTMEPDVLKQMAEFVCSCRPLPTLAAAVRDFAETRGDSSIPPLLRYILCRTFEMEDDTKARSHLEGVPLKKIKAPNILLDLARLYFRFAKWDRAVQAAKRVLQLSSGSEVAKRIVISAYSFGCQLNRAKKSLYMLAKPQPALCLSREQLSTILEHAANMQKSAPATQGFPRNVSEVDCHGPSRESKLGLRKAGIIETEGKHGKVTVSVIGTLMSGPNAWDVLFRVDWRFPHVMIQLLTGRRILHAFVRADGPYAWQWEEVPISIRDNTKQAGPATVLFMEAELDRSEPSGRAIRNDLLAQVESELESVCPE